MTVYIPALFDCIAPEQVPALVAAWPFATLVTSGALGLYATHAPLVLHDGRLVGHIARANPQVADLDGPILAIFHGPHAMIRSDWYVSPARQVPTWSYAAVHATGRARPTDPLRALDLAMSAFQPGERVPSGEPDRDRYVARLSAGIYAFEIEVERWEAKAKLGQNRDAPDRARVRAALRERGGADDVEIAAWMDRIEP